MARINISLVGGQAMPINRGLEELGAFDKVILIHSAETKEIAVNISDNCNSPTELRPFNALDYPMILKAFDNLLNEFTEEEVVINITSGTKIWAIALAILATKRENCTLVYVEQNNTLQDLTRLARYVPEKDLEISTIFRNNGKEIPAHVNFGDYTEADKRVLMDIMGLLDFNYRDFKDLTTLNDPWWRSQLESKRNRLPYLRLDRTGSSIEFDKDNSLININLQKRYGQKTVVLQSPHVDKIVFNTAWFEYEIALMLSEWKEAKDIWLNVLVPYADKETKNEIDIIVSTGTKLLFVECKTKISSKTEIDKFKSAVRNFGGLSSKAIFVTETTLDDRTKEKCRDNGIVSFSLEDAVPAYNRHSNHFKESIWNGRKKALFKLLNQEMISNNT